MRGHVLFEAGGLSLGATSRRGTGRGTRGSTDSRRCCKGGLRSCDIPGLVGHEVVPGNILIATGLASDTLERSCDEEDLSLIRKVTHES